MNRTMNWRKHIAYPLLCARSGSKELTYLKWLNKTQHWSHAKLVAYKIDKLRVLLASAIERIPYYKNAYQGMEQRIQDFASLNDLNAFPLLSKKQVQENFDGLRDRTIDSEQIYQDQTGGSTGVPTRFMYTNARREFRSAAALRHDSWAGLEVGDPLAVIWGARKDFLPVKTIKAKIWSFLAQNQIVLDSSSITDEVLERFVTEMNRFRPEHILAYAQSLELFAKYLKDTGADIPKLDSIITSAELLTAERRALIEETLHAPVFNRYGSRETSVIASECEHHTMHIHDEGIHVECIKEDGTPCAYGEEGEIVVTDLLNHAFPLIRYRIGDIGMPLENHCPCGRALSVLDITSGRTSDFIITPKNRKVSGAAITAFVCTKIDGLHRVQFYQTQTDKVTVKVIPNNRFTDETVKAFDHRIRAFLDAIEPEIEIVDEIPVPESGKHQFVINELLR